MEQEKLHQAGLRAFASLAANDEDIRKRVSNCNWCFDISGFIHPWKEVEQLQYMQVQVYSTVVKQSHNILRVSAFVK